MDELWDFLSDDAEAALRLLRAGWWRDHKKATGRLEWCRPDSADRYGTTEDALAALMAKGGKGDE